MDKFSAFDISALNLTKLQETEVTLEKAVRPTTMGAPIAKADCGTFWGNPGCADHQGGGCITGQDSGCTSGQSRWSITSYKINMSYKIQPN